MIKSKTQDAVCPVMAQHVTHGIIDGTMIESLIDPHAPEDSRDFVRDLIASACGPAAGALARALLQITRDYEHITDLVDPEDYMAMLRRVHSPARFDPDDPRARPLTRA